MFFRKCCYSTCWQRFGSIIFCVVDRQASRSFCLPSSWCFVLTFLDHFQALAAAKSAASFLMTASNDSARADVRVLFAAAGLLTEILRFGLTKDTKCEALKATMQTVQSKEGLAAIRRLLCYQSPPTTSNGINPLFFSLFFFAISPLTILATEKREQQHGQQEWIGFGLDGSQCGVRGEGLLDSAISLLLNVTKVAAKNAKDEQYGQPAFASFVSVELAGSRLWEPLSRQVSGSGEFLSHSSHFPSIRCLLLPSSLSAVRASYRHSG
jgi:hypothetical protein